MIGRKLWIWTALILAIAGVWIARSERRRPTASATVAPPAAAALARPAARLPRLVDLGAGACVPCKMMAPILEDMRQSYTGRLDVTFIDVWQNPDEATAYGVNLIPTQIFYDREGQERFRHEGFFGKEDILAKWKELGVELN